MAGLTELSEEELCFSFNPSLRGNSTFMGFCVAFLLAPALSLVYSAVSVFFPLKNGISLVYWFYGGAGVGGAIWGYVSGSRANGKSISYNRDHIQLFYDRILKQEIRWEDVARVEDRWNYVIHSKSGETLEIPFLVFKNQAFEVRTLRNQLRRYVRQEELNPARYLIWGAVLAGIGVLGLNFGQRPPAVLADGDVHRAVTWLRMVPFLLGAVGACLGFIAISAGVTVLTNRKKPHPYLLTPQFISKGRMEFAWSEVVRIRRSSARDMVLKLEFRKGRPVMVDCRLYSNGEELRDAILAHDERISLPEAVPGSLSIPEGGLNGSTLKSQIGAVGFFGTLAAVAAAMALAGPLFGWQIGRAGGGNGVSVMMGFFAAILIGLIAMICYEVRLGSDSITIRWYIGPRRSISFLEIERIEVKTLNSKNGEVEFTTVYGPKSKVAFASKFPEYADIRDAVLSQVSAEKIRRS